MNKRKLIAIALFSVVLVVVVVFAALRNTAPSEHEIYVNERVDKIIFYNDNILNSISCALIGTTDKYILYSDNNGLYRINKDGSGKLELDQGLVSNINIYDNSIYYTKNITPTKIQNANNTHIIYKQELDGQNKTEISTVECQRITSMLVANDLIYYQPVIFEGNGGINDLDEPTGKLIDEYRVMPIYGEYSTKIPSDKFHSAMRTKYLYTQSQLDAMMREEYPDMRLKSSKYTINNKLYFEAHGDEGGRYAGLFCIDQKDDKLKLLATYKPDASPDTYSFASISGFSYNANNLHYIVVYRKMTENESLAEKWDLYTLDINEDKPVLISTVFKSPDYQ